MNTWQTFYDEQPYGLWRDDFRTGLVASTVANTVSKKSFKPSDFMPFYDSNITDVVEDLEGAIIV